MLKVEAVKTRIFNVGEDLNKFIVESLKGRKLKENQILCITSKIVSLAENKIVSKTKISKKNLIKKEADIYLADGPYDTSLTIKHGIMIPSAGIDESNADGDFFILYPKKPFKTAEQICKFLKKYYRLKNCGVIITDSHTQPLRKGVVGIALAYWGFDGVNDLVGKPDLFGKKLKYTSVHIADSLAVAAVYVMGEANEAKPLATITASGVTFRKKIKPTEGKIKPQLDLYYSLYKKH